MLKTQSNAFLNSILNIILYALIPFYLLGHCVNFFILSKPRKFPIKVICIGNASCGGNHKTPIAIETARHLISLGHKVAIISRGYPNVISQTANEVQADSPMHIANDEALLVKQTLPECHVITSKSKKNAIQKSIELGASVAILDDGLQNNTVHKDINVLSITDSETHLMPFGRLREPISWATKRSQIILHTDAFDPKTISTPKQRKSQSVHVMNPTFTCSVYLKDREIACMSSIAKPAKFIKELEAQGACIKMKYTYPDHHTYTEDELKDIVTTAATNALLPIITTSKDLVKIPSSLKGNFVTLNMKINIEEEYFKKLETLL